MLRENPVRGNAHAGLGGGLGETERIERPPPRLGPTQSCPPARLKGRRPGPPRRIQPARPLEQQRGQVDQRHPCCAGIQIALRHRSVTPKPRGEPINLYLNVMHHASGPDFPARCLLPQTIAFEVFGLRAEAHETANRRTALPLQRPPRAPGAGSCSRRKAATSPALPRRLDRAGRRPPHAAAPPDPAARPRVPAVRWPFRICDVVRAGARCPKGPSGTSAGPSPLRRPSSPHLEGAGSKGRDRVAPTGAISSRGST
jgi:hypothetical protein